jgi:hypothetical protein
MITCFGSTLTDQNCMHEETRSYHCYHSVQSLLYSRLLQS